MTNARSRINTFAEYWPATFKHMIENIADAGLFYSGSGDETVCFFCDARVRDWHQNDDAWQRHNSQNPQCFFVVSVKGKDYKHRRDSELVEENHVSENVVADDDVQEKLECIICLERQRDVALLPCKHFCVCVQCYFGLQEKCPTCQQDVTDFLKVFVV
jgi:hypothetical protein